MAAGLLVALLFALCVIWTRADQIITGTALTLLSVGATGTLYRAMFGSSGAALEHPDERAASDPGLAPSADRRHGALLAAAHHLFRVSRSRRHSRGGSLARTPDWRFAPSESDQTRPRRQAIAVDRMRALAILFGGALGGLAGGTLVLAQAGTFAEGMSAGRGFIAIAIVVLGRWTPLRRGGGALLFGAASALQFAFQAMGWNVPVSGLSRRARICSPSPHSPGRSAARGRRRRLGRRWSRVAESAAQRNATSVSAFRQCAGPAHTPLPRAGALDQRVGQPVRRRLGQRRATERRSRRVELRQPIRWRLTSSSFPNDRSAYAS